MNDKKIINPTKSPSVQKDELKSVKTRPMNFSEAIREILKGRNVTKLEWKNRKYIAFLYKEDATLVLQDPDGQMHSWILSEGDMISKDYVMV